MSSLLILFLLCFLLLLVLKCPISYSMLIASLFYLIMRGSLSITIIPEKMTSGINSFPLIAIPLFILAGRIMNNAGITSRIFNFCMAFVGHYKAGLAYVNVIASIIFAGITGSSVADVAGLGAVEIKAMKDEGYDPAYSAAITAASSCIGPIIPPSIIMIVIGVMAELSIGRLFAGGMIPGLLMGASLLVLIFIQTRTAPKNIPAPRTKLTPSERKKAIKDGLPSVLSPVIILGGILSGVVTPSEAGVIAVVYSLILGFAYKDLKIKDIPTMLFDAALSTGVVMFVIACAQMFGWVITIERVAHTLSAMVTQSSLPNWAILLMINFGVFIIGCFLEGTAIVMIVVPVVLPLIRTLGMDPIQFAAFLSVNIMIGLLTPPVGMSVYIASDVAGIRAHEGFKKTIPFIIPIVVTLMLTTFIPQVSLWLPTLIYG
jgi:tripartite ATP-independent transporter DctM subunit